LPGFDFNIFFKWVKIYKINFIIWKGVYEVKMNIRFALRMILAVCLAFFLFTCDSSKPDTGENDEQDNDTFDVDLEGIPRFVNVNYLELAKVYRISKFRSAVGHDYSDDFEACRSMKHYFQPRGNVNWSQVQVFAPVTGKISTVYEEWAGTQLWVQSDLYPAFFFIIFHIRLSNPLSIGDTVVAGQNLGTHVGSQTMSDIAVGVNTPRGWKLISYFDTLSDMVFQNYLNRGIVNRGQLIISREQRDSDPLTCAGDTFTNTGNLDHWVVLH
jgi:hypothetical protein